MRYTPPKFDSLSDMAAIDVGRLTEEEARAILERIRWPEGPRCPHCDSVEVARIVPRTTASKTRDGLLQCRACRKQFTVTTQTVMHGSKITLRQWVQAFHSLCSHKKGVSSLQLKRNLGLGSYESAWHLSHRIRMAMNQEPMKSLLKGAIEADETYVGGKSREGRRGLGSERKTPVIAVLERGGRVRTRVVPKVTASTLKAALQETVDAGQSVLNTDENPGYIRAGRGFRKHRTVNHSQGEYARRGAHCNGAESYFALLKRGVHGTFHHVSRQHLHRYADEFSFRWSNRMLTDGERASVAIMGAVGKRLINRKGK